MDKKNLRKKAKEIRSSLDIKNISEKIIANIMNFEPYQRARHIMLFYPLEHEIDLRKLLSDNSKIFYLPKVKGDNLLVCPYNVQDILTTSKFNTKEPLSEPIEDTSILDIVFVPALMSDKHKNRLGYGGGFYDRFLSKQNPKTLKIVAIPSKLIINEIPPDTFDEKIDVTICETSIIE